MKKNNVRKLKQKKKNYINLASKVKFNKNIEDEYEVDEEYEDDEEYGDEAEYENDVEYEDDEDDEEYEDEAEYEHNRLIRKKMNRKGAYNKKKRQKNKKKKSVDKVAFHEKCKSLFKNISAIDGIIGVTGIAVLITALVTVTTWNNARVEAVQVSNMVELGEQLSNIEVIGQSGLLAVADAKSAPITVEETQEPEQSEEPEKEEPKIVEVTVNMTSVEKDLKVKFVNKQTKKVISGIAFKMEQTGPDNATKTLTDDDKDGIIYQKNMTPGVYAIKLISVDGYTFPEEASKVTVKDKIEYKKIEVADEVKSEAEVNTAKEDTQVKVVEESKLKDTVEFVESTKTAIDSGSNNDSEYEKVDKANIPDPSQVSASGYFLRLTASGNEIPTEPTTEPWTEPTNVPVTGISISESTKTLTVGDKSLLNAWVAPSNATNQKISFSSDRSDIVSVGPSGTITAITAGEAWITVASEDGNYKTACKVTVNAKVPDTIKATGVTLDKTTLSVNVGSTDKVVATVAPDNATNKKVNFSSDNTAVATVATDGIIKGIAPGTATLTAITEEGGFQATCTVTVNKLAVGVTVDKTSVDLLLKSTTQITPTPSGFLSTPTYTWESSNTKSATVDKNGKVTAVASGTATITVTATLGNEKATATTKITVRSNAETDATTKLKDKAGNQLFVKEDGKYREAVYADYFTTDKFYKKITTNYKYTGWQTIDNKTYYFDKNGNKVTGTQVIQGVQYTFGSDGALSMGSGTLGIDVSKWNGNINWTAVKNSGVSYVIIRCGYRGSSTGALIQDSKFTANIKGAQAAGIKVGVYFFTQAVNEVEAVEEASMVLNLIKGYNISMPIYIDTEGSGGRADGIDKATRTAVCKAFCATIQNSGRTAGVYAAKNWFETKLNASALSGYKIWLAQYATKPTYSGRYDMWQYTSKGSIGGISGNVDLNITY